MHVPERLPEHLQTARLFLRIWQAGLSEAGALREALDVSDAHLRPWIPFMRHEPKSLAQTLTTMQGFERDRQHGRACRYAMWARDSGALIGECMVFEHESQGVLEIGYWLHVDHQGQGFATEGVLALCQMMLAHEDVLALCMTCDVNNIASNQLAKRLGTQRSQPAEQGDDHQVHVWWMRAL